MNAQMSNPTLSSGHGQRTYRHQDFGSRLTAFGVVCQETDLLIRADRRLADETREKVIELRAQIETYIQRHPDFATTLMPWTTDDPAPAIVRRMIQAGNTAGVGPMAAVAGAIAGGVGRHLLTYSRQVVVENGGDIFLKTEGPATAGLLAGKSPLSMKIGIRLARTGDGVGICTSSGTVDNEWPTVPEDVHMTKHSPLRAKRINI